jgi:hypothetical protein
MNNNLIAPVFSFTKKLSKALRMSSDFSRELDTHTSTDVIWLSDALYNLECLEVALLYPDPTYQKLNVIITSYKKYLNPKIKYNSVSMDTFNRWDIDIAGAISLFEDLKACKKMSLI